MIRYIILLDVTIHDITEYNNIINNECNNIINNECNNK